MNETQRTCVWYKWLPSKYYWSLFKSFDFDFWWKILLQPSDVVLSHIRKGLLQKLFMFFCELETTDKFPNSLDSCKNSILTAKRMFSEENLESSFIFMFVGFEVGEWASELVEVIEEQIDVVDLFLLHWYLPFNYKIFLLGIYIFSYPIEFWRRELKLNTKFWKNKVNVKINKFHCVFYCRQSPKILLLEFLKLRCIQKSS